MSDQWSAAPFQRIASYYDDLVGRHGHDPKACDYGRRESQRIKFQVLAEVMDLRDKRILDVGCGFADYARYLAETVGPVTYTGIDLSSRMIQEGKRLSPHLDLRVANLLATDVTSWDVVTANGIFYLLGEEARNLMPQLIRAMFERGHGGRLQFLEFLGRQAGAGGVLRRPLGDRDVLPNAFPLGGAPSQLLSP